MIAYERAVRFEEADPAGIVFFACFSNYAHEAMEHFFSDLPGGYPALIMKRRVGLPAVTFHADFHAPLRYGDQLRIETSVAHLGGRSATFRYRFFRTGDAELVAELRHTIVTSDLVAMRSCDMPDDLRDQLRSHLENEPAAGVD